MPGVYRSQTIVLPLFIPSQTTFLLYRLSEARGMETMKRYQRLKPATLLNHELKSRFSLEIFSWKEPGVSGQAADSTGISMQLVLSTCHHEI